MPVDRSAEIQSFFSFAQSQALLSSLSRLLEWIGRKFGADCAIIWAIDERKSDSLFTMCHWFDGSEIVYSFHDMPLSESVTGKCIISNTPRMVDSVADCDDVYKGSNFWQRFGMNAFYSTPIKFNDNVDGAVNFYFREVDPPIGVDTLRQLDNLSCMIPSLYSSIRDRSSLDLLNQLNDSLQQADQKDVDASNDGQVRGVLDRICEFVSKAYRCAETSVFLENPISKPGEYVLCGTSWSGEFDKMEYEPSKSEGLTGYVLEQSCDVQIFDLRRFLDDYEVISRKYPDIKWSDSLQIDKSLRDTIWRNSESELPPLGFMAVPIQVGERTFGAIRCCAVTSGPFYFSGPEISLLKLVAGRIAQTWSNWIESQKIRESKASLESLIETLNTLHGSILKEVERKYPKEARVFSQALRKTAEFVEGAHILDIRWTRKVERGGELYFKTVFGSHWNAGSKDQKDARKGKSFPLDGSSLGARSLNEDEVIYVKKVTEHDDYDETFAGVESMVLAPIKGVDKYGVLDIRNCSAKPFPDNIAAIAEILGKQLGIYYDLVTTIGEAKKLNDEKRQVYMDLEHQIRGPISFALSRSSMAIDKYEQEPDDALRNMIAARGQCRKAKRVSNNLAAFVSLAKEEVPQTRITEKPVGNLEKLAVEMASDAENFINPREKKIITVEREQFGRHRNMYLWCDSDFIEQSVSCLVDNAVKYGYNGNVITIEVSSVDERYLWLSFSSVGLAIGKPDVDKCKERHWQSSDAKLVVGEGSGLGLWIVDHIMRAQGGVLQVEPTDNDGVTRVSLAIPIARRR